LHHHWRDRPHRLAGHHGRRRPGRSECANGRARCPALVSHDGNPGRYRADGIHGRLRAAHLSISPRRAPVGQRHAGARSRQRSRPAGRQDVRRRHLGSGRWLEGARRRPPRAASRMDRDGLATGGEIREPILAGPDLRTASLQRINDPPYLGPFALVNATLNLNAGSELAKQERKAASFAFSPTFCGFLPAASRRDLELVKQKRGEFETSGYVPTLGYSHPDGPEMGTTVAISGAAANPNMGYHTSGSMAFLLTVFDARLGWWLGNPRWRGPSRYPGPVFAWTYLIAELLGQTTGRSRFVNLSDGGHFDNLGLYELVRRRCHYIIAGDAEEDAKLAFESLGGAIRKCRADFGVEIDIDPEPIRIVNGRSGAHCVLGRILYPEGARGYLFYLKAILTGDEPSDVTEYQTRFPEFPHQSTADQFFSESQFESYRRQIGRASW